MDSETHEYGDRGEHDKREEKAPKWGKISDVIQTATHSGSEQAPYATQHGSSRDGGVGGLLAPVLQGHEARIVRERSENTAEEIETQVPSL